MGPRAGLDGCGKCRPHRDSISRPSSPSRIAVPTAPFRYPISDYSTMIILKEDIKSVRHNKTLSAVIIHSLSGTVLKILYAPLAQIHVDMNVVILNSHCVSWDSPL